MKPIDVIDKLVIIPGVACIAYWIDPALCAIYLASEFVFDLWWYGIRNDRRKP